MKRMIAVVLMTILALFGTVGVANAKPLTEKQCVTLKTVTYLAAVNKQKWPTAKAKLAAVNAAIAKAKADCKPAPTPPPLTPPSANSMSPTADGVSGISIENGQPTVFFQWYRQFDPNTHEGDVVFEFVNLCPVGWRGPGSSDGFNDGGNLGTAINTRVVGDKFQYYWTGAASPQPPFDVIFTHSCTQTGSVPS